MPIPLALIPPLIGAAASIAGGTAQGVIGGINQRKMLEYNSPKNQVARLREAGLPIAAMTSGNTGNQAAPTPSTDLGFQKAGENIGQYYSTKKQIEEINKIKEDITREKLLNEKLQGELQWYRAGAGTDPGRTNLSSMLAMEQSMKGALNVGQGFANTIAGAQARNIDTKINLENQEQRQRITNAIQSYNSEGIKMEGYKLDNALKEIETKWNPSMNAARLRGILLDNNIKVTEGGLRKLDLEIREATKANVITKSSIETALARLGLEQFGQNYKFNKEWQDIASKGRELVGEKPTSLWRLGDQVGSWLFTTISNAAGNGMIPNIPNLGDQSKTFNTNNYINQK